MIKNNYHTHTKYCNHASGEMEDYIKVAIENNFDELGFSDHMPVEESLLTDEKYKSLIYLSNPFKSRMEMDDLNKYISELNYLKNKYSNQIKILIGFECEYSEKVANTVKSLSSMCDYLILGMHHFYSEGCFFDTCSCDDMKRETVVLYAKECAKALDTGLFKCIAHPDLFMYNYLMDEGRTFTKECEEAARIIVEAAIRNNVFLEINVHQVKFSEKNGIIPWRYPREEFWKIVSEYKDAKVIIGMDAHKPEQVVDKNYDKIMDLVRKCNIKLCNKMTF